MSDGAHVAILGRADPELAFDLVFLAAHFMSFLMQVQDVVLLASHALSSTGSEQIRPPRCTSARRAHRQELRPWRHPRIQRVANEVELLRQARAESELAFEPAHESMTSYMLSMLAVCLSISATSGTKRGRSRSALQHRRSSSFGRQLGTSSMPICT